MKCIVLTGGAGDHMWPVSRKNYPKQFVYLDGEHSMFQETILRNIPYCDEFWIFSSISYKNIIQGQMQPFTGLSYRCFYEEEGRLTAPALIFAALFAEPEEDLLIVSTDDKISGNGYKEAIVSGRQIIAEGNIAVLCSSDKDYSRGVAFLKAKKEGGVNCIYYDSNENNIPFPEEYLMDTGMLMGKANVLLKEFQKCTPVLYKQMEEIFAKIYCGNIYTIIPAILLNEVKAESIGDALVEKSNAVKILKCNFSCRRIRSLEFLAKIWDENSKGQVIKNDCNNVSIINFSDDQLVVGNDLKDLLIVNTADAVYISKKGSADSIKSIIMDENVGMSPKVINESPIFYTVWGYRENLQLEKNSWVRRVTVYPGCSLKRHKHNVRSENWTVIKGEATVFLKNEWHILSVGESIHINKGERHQLVNNTFENVVIMETAVGEILDETNDRDIKYEYSNAPVPDNIIKMIPNCKEKIWGGTRLAKRYNKNMTGSNIAESWEVSAHPNGQSIVATGSYKGKTFGEYIDIMGKGILGWKCQLYDRFPVLIKFIDAQENLSVQVHPGDDYALINENQYGKNEMWYIVDAEEEAYIYCGFKKKVTKEEIRKRTADNTLTEIMKAIPVKKGETYFIPTGTIHAIGKGIIICEIQQNSDVTYRLYDYGRKNKDGKTRDLHIDKALDVLIPDETLQMPIELKESAVGEILCRCKYFTVERYLCKEKTVMWGSQSSFTAIVAIEGCGIINVGTDSMEFARGESFFVSAGIKAITIEGNAEILVIRM